MLNIVIPVGKRGSGQLLYIGMRLKYVAVHALYCTTYDRHNSPCPYYTEITSVRICKATRQKLL